MNSYEHRVNVPTFAIDIIMIDDINLTIPTGCHNIHPSIHSCVI